MALGNHEGQAYHYGSDEEMNTSKTAKLVEEIRQLNNLGKNDVSLPHWNESSLILVGARVKVEKLVLPEGYRIERMQSHQGKDRYTGPWKLSNESPENRRTTGWLEFEIRRA